MSTFILSSSTINIAEGDVKKQEEKEVASIFRREEKKSKSLLPPFDKTGEEVDEDEDVEVVVVVAKKEDLIEGNQEPKHKLDTTHTDRMAKILRGYMIFSRPIAWR